MNISDRKWPHAFSYAIIDNPDQGHEYLQNQVVFVWERYKIGKCIVEFMTPMEGCNTCDKYFNKNIGMYINGWEMRPLTPVEINMTCIKYKHKRVMNPNVNYTHAA